MLTRRDILTDLAVATVTAGVTPLALAEVKRPQMAIVAKVKSSPWFDAMARGVQQAAQKYLVDASMVWPAGLEPIHQVRAVEDLIDRHVDVIAVVPNDSTALTPALKRARAAGIKVIAHEGPNLAGVDWDIELTTVDQQSKLTADALAFNMAAAGTYIVIVGSLAVPLHNAWADACLAILKNKYPNMQAVPERFGVGENLYDSYKLVLDQIRAHPDLKGILAFGSQGPIGAARALDERGKGKQIALVGTFLPSQGASYIKEGTIRAGFCWSPILAGNAAVQIGAMMVRGQPIVDGMKLPDIGKVRVDAEKRLIQASRLETINRRTIDQLIAEGL